MFSVAMPDVLARRGCRRGLVCWGSPGLREGKEGKERKRREGRKDGMPLSHYLGVRVSLHLKLLGWTNQVMVYRMLLPSTMLVQEWCGELGYVISNGCR
jgi:hypothetical protein